MPYRNLSTIRRCLALALIAVLLGLAPLAVAQDVHHELAAADTDGHDHSETDLCQWVQHHTAGSIDCDVLRLAACGLVRPHALPVDSVLLSIDLSSVGPSRAPPRA
jgi:hypothetical protein